jgi:hypothetical protein
MQKYLGQLNPCLTLILHMRMTVDGYRLPLLHPRARILSASCNADAQTASRSLFTLHALQQLQINDLSVFSKSDRVQGSGCAR